jgi:hypothetical protein
MSINISHIIKNKSNILWITLIIYISVLITLKSYLPFELEWMEGGCIATVQRVLGGKSLYCEPTIEYIPFIYTPFYYYVSAPIMKLTGYPFLACRLVSLISFMGILMVIYHWLKKETNDKLAALSGGAFFASCYYLTGQWYGLARVDILFCVLLLVGLYLLRFYKNWKGIIAAAVFTWLAWFTKQTALLVMVPVYIYLIIEDWKKGIAYTGVFLSLLIVTTGYMDYISQGWFSRYIFIIPAGHPVLRDMIWNFWLKDIGFNLLIAIGFSLIYFWKAWKTNKTVFGFYLSFGMGAIGASWVSRIHEGGDVNVLIPMVLWLAICLGLGIHKTIQIIDKISSPYKNYSYMALLVIIFMQLLILQRDPRLSIPSHEDTIRIKSFEAYLAGLPGKVYIPCHGYLVQQKGQPANANLVAGWDILRSKDEQSKKILVESICNSLEKKEFDWIILDNNDAFFLDLKKYYKKVGVIPPGSRPSNTVTGYKTHPMYLYAPL